MPGKKHERQSVYVQYVVLTGGMLFECCLMMYYLRSHFSPFMLKYLELVCNNNNNNNTNNPILVNNGQLKECTLCKNWFGIGMIFNESSVTKIKQLIHSSSGKVNR